jgi:hypothetical protein
MGKPSRSRHRVDEAVRTADQNGSRHARCSEIVRTLPLPVDLVVSTGSAPRSTTMTVETSVPHKTAAGRPSDQDLRLRIQAEFEEMPGLTLTLRQASRLFNIDVATCERLLAQLVLSGALRMSEGTFVLSQPRDRWPRFH